MTGQRTGMVSPMTSTLTATDLKATVSAVLERVAEGEEIDITKHGRVVARLVPARGPQLLRGLHAGRVRAAVADDELLSTGETWECS